MRRECKKKNGKKEKEKERRGEKRNEFGRKEAQQSITEIESCPLLRNTIISSEPTSQKNLEH